jgi:hypothetical protein
MASRRDIEAGRAYVELYIKNSKFLQGVNAINAQIRNTGTAFMKFGAMASAAGLAITGAFTAAARSFASFGDNLHKMSARTGASVEFLSEMKFAAEQSGASIEGLGEVLQKMNRRFGRVTAGAGSATQTGAVEELGLSLEKLKGLDAEGRFLAFADAMKNYGDNAAAAGLAQRIFGTGVDKLLPLIWEGRDGIEKLREEARKLGLTMGTEDANAAAAYTDAMNRLTSVLRAAWLKIGASVAPVLTELTNRLATGLGPLIQWIDKNRELVATAMKVGAGIAAVGAVLFTTGAAMVGLSVAIASTVSVLTTMVGLLASPVFLATAAGIAAIGYAAYELYQSGHLDAWIASVSDGLGSIADDFKTAWGGIADAIKAGDVELAMDIVAATLKVAWARVVKFWMDETQGFRDWWGELTVDIASIFIDAVADMKLAWLDLVGLMESPWMKQLAATVAGPFGIKLWNAAKNAPPRLRRSIEADRKAAQAALAGEGARRHFARRSGLGAAQSELDAAQDALNGLVKEAGEAAEHARRMGEMGAPGLPAPDFAAPEFGPRQAAAVYGTLSSAAALAMSGGTGGGPQERTAKGVEELNRSVLDLVDINEKQEAALKAVLAWG